QARAMGRDTAGVKGMNVSRGENWVLAMDVARDDDELLVVTENGYGKRSLISDYPRKGRGSMGVKTISLTERKGGLAGALIAGETTTQTTDPTASDGAGPDGNEPSE